MDTEEDDTTVTQDFFKNRMFEAWNAGNELQARGWFITGVAMFPGSSDLLVLTDNVSGVNCCL